MGVATVKRISLTADDWAEAALDALARGGLSAVAVEPLAKTLGATKGSFYWHFSGRDALIEATLALWEQRDTDRVIATIDPAQDVGTRLRGLLRLVLSAVREEPGAGAGAVELALQATAGHPRVAPALSRVTERRLVILTALFAELGLTKAQARDRGLLAYAAFLGHAQLAHATPGLVPRGRAFQAYVDRTVEALVTS
jgi:AcrR family transcriptional regulator